MGVAHGYSKIITSGSSLIYDVGDTLNSYLGEPTTNILPSPNPNSYPTYGNGWATYNTNQYCGNNGCGNFWSIPSISSVSSNIVTTSAAHGMRTFDVLQPQSSGGGVNAGQNYLVRAWNSTQFSLYAYNSSQDGSQGYINPSTGWYKVQDDYATDTRVSVNSSSFPTMWWGYPHLPNSGLIKEVIPKGCNLFPTKTDCLRLHWYRPDGVCDGMAYGVTPSVTNGVTYTFSFWMRAVDAAAAGNGGSVQFYNTGNATGGSTGWTLGAVNEWKQYQLTSTATATGVYLFYWFPNSGPMTVDIANIQFEQKGHATPFTLSSRSVTQGLIDLTGKSTLDLTNMSYDSNAAMVFDGTSNRINLGATSFGITNQFTVEVLCKPTTNQTNGMFNFRQNSSYATRGIMAHWPWADGTCYFDIVNTAGTFHRWYKGGLGIAGTTSLFQFRLNTSGNVTVKQNGVTLIPDSTDVFSGTVSVGDLATIGDFYDTGGMPWPGSIYVFKVYNRCLSDDECTINYNHYKTRFNLS